MEFSESISNLGVICIFFLSYSERPKRTISMKYRYIDNFIGFKNLKTNLFFVFSLNLTALASLIDPNLVIQEKKGFAGEC